jgi:hypothetical protein
MGITGGSFLNQVNDIVPGLGFKKAESVAILARDTSGAPLTNATTPPIAAVETSFLAIVQAASTTFVCELVWQVPRDYDQVKDELRLRFLTNSAGDTDVPTLDAAVYSKRAGVALTADLDPVISAAVPNSTTKAAWREINIDSQGLQPGDVLSIEVSSSAHTTDALDIYDMEMEYRSTLVYYDKDDRS